MLAGNSLMHGLKKLTPLLLGGLPGAHAAFDKHGPRLSVGASASLVLLFLSLCLTLRGFFRLRILRRCANHFPVLLLRPGSALQGPRSVRSTRPPPEPLRGGFSLSEDIAQNAQIPKSS